MKRVVLFTLWASWVLHQPTEDIVISSGPVRGTLGHGETFKQYLAIPYAYSGLDNRFQASRPQAPWDSVYRAVNEHVKCPQRYAPSLVLGQEDCLTLNVYTPLQIDDPLPVMVYFHGGGFREGSSSPFLYGAGHLVEKDVILVTVNYRLEVIGFLCLGIEEAPGNIGLKDQVDALKWVQKNIKQFGGNPNDVTIFGESAGASSVSYHILSPMSRGLFHKAILQSGSAITPWSYQHEPLTIAREFAAQMGFYDNEPKKIYDFLMTKSPEELLKTRVPRQKGNIILSETIFVPCVEKIIPGVEGFLTEHPHEILLKGTYNKVPMIIGYNSAEGFMFVGKENKSSLDEFDIFKSLPRDLEFKNHLEEQTIAQQVKELYIDDKRDNVNLSRFYGDPYFKFPVITTTELMLNQNSTIFNYRLSYNGWMNIAKWYFGFGDQIGVSHADDLFYMFKVQAPTPWMFEKEMITRIVTLWTNFAKFGDPTPKTSELIPKRWFPTNKDNPHVYVIDKEISYAPLWDSQEMLFWNQTYTKFRRKTYEN